MRIGMGWSPPARSGPSTKAPERTSPPPAAHGGPPRAQQRPPGDGPLPAGQRFLPSGPRHAWRGRGVPPAPPASCPRAPGLHCRGYSAAAEAAARLARGVPSPRRPSSRNSASLPDIRREAPRGVAINPTANPRPSLILMKCYQGLLMMVLLVTGMQVAVALCQLRLIRRPSSRALVSQRASPTKMAWPCPARNRLWGMTAYDLLGLDPLKI
jgi:hypothetical protein